MGPRSFHEFVFRRSRSHWPMLSVVSVGVVAAVVTIAASVIYFDSLGDIALEREIATDNGASHDIVISGREVDVDAASNKALLGLVDTTVTEIASSITTDVTLAYGSPTLLIEQDENVDPEVETDESWRAVMMVAPKLGENSVLTEGSWPSNAVDESDSGQLLIDVAVDEAEAEAFGVGVGDIVVVAPFWDDVNDSIAVRISGTFVRGDNAREFWKDLDEQFGLDDTDLKYLPLVPDAGIFESTVGPYLPGMTVRYFWRYNVDSSRVKASGANKLLIGFDEIRAQLQSKISNYSQDIPLQDVLARNQQQTFFSRLPMTVVFSVIAAVVLYFVGTMSILMVETQTSDIARLRTRAATVRQVIGAFVIEGAVVALLAILLAPPIAALLVKWIGVIPLFEALNGGNPLPASLGQSAYVVSILTGLAGFFAMVIPASMAAKKTVVSSVRDSTRPAAQSAMQKYYLDVALLGLLLMFASQLTSEGSFVDVPGVGAASVDKINVAMPALVLAFGGFVALRAFPALVEVVARLTSLPWISKFVSPAITLVLWQMARNPRHYSRLSLLMILTAGLGVFASSFAGTLDVSAADRARYQSGADLRVNGVSYTNRVQAGETFRRIAGTPGVESAAPAFRAVGVDLTADVGSTFTYLGVDPGPMSGIAWSRPDFASTSLDEQMSKLTESRTGIPIPSDARWISLKVRPTVRRADSRISARVSDSTGRLFTLNIGSLLPRPSAGRPFTCDVAQVHLPPNWCTIAGSVHDLDFTGVNPVPPLRLEFIGVGLPNVERGRFSRTEPPFLDAGSVEIDELSFVLENGDTQVIEEFNEDSSWMTVEPGLNQYGARLEPLFTKPETIEEAEGFEPQDQGIAVMTWNPVIVTQLRGVTVGSENAPIPVIASTGFMDRGGYEVGERINVDIQGNGVPVRLAGVTDYFPTLDPEFSTFVVGDIRSTWMALNANRMRNAEQANEVWIETGDTAPSEVGNSMRGRTATPPSLIAQDQLLRDAAVDPLISAGWRALLAIAFATVLAASAVGFLVYSQVTFASRMTEYAVVRTLGLTTKQVLGLVTLELLMVLVPAVLVGGLLGMRMGATIIPFLVTSGEGVRVVPPVVLDVDWKSVGVLVGVVGAIFLAISIGLISSVRKISPPRVMRMGQS
ncbi:MAG: ABC transporter permease [Chloroflexi bacterium]|jgi:ABC-type antimicrobial peptide transport system permease subunit|nr:ABC transporter permease [Chloroflexota bacterium]